MSFPNSWGYLDSRVKRLTSTWLSRTLWHFPCLWNKALGEYFFLSLARWSKFFKTTYSGSVIRELHSVMTTTFYGTVGILRLPWIVSLSPDGFQEGFPLWAVVPMGVFMDEDEEHLFWVGESCRRTTDSRRVRGWGWVWGSCRRVVWRYKTKGSQFITSCSLSEPLKNFLYTCVLGDLKVPHSRSLDKSCSRGPPSLC